MMHSNSRQSVRVPRPATQPQAAAPVPKPSTPPQLAKASRAAQPPPSPTRPLAKPKKASPPPLPQPVLLTDSDLVDDEDVTHVVRSTQPTSVDVEIDCFSRTEPPPESRPRRRRALLACITGGLVLVAATFVSLLGRPLALQAFQRLQAESPNVPRAPAMLSVAALSPSTSEVAVGSSAAPGAKPIGLALTPNDASNAGPRPKLSAHSKRSKAPAVSPKKPSQRNQPQH